MYFDVNGVIGKGALGGGEYPDIESLLTKMNYLGIERSLAWSMDARDSNTFLGNKRLIELVNSKKEYRDKIIPALVIKPAMFFAGRAMKNTVGE